MRVLWLSHVVPFPPKAGVLLRAYNLLKCVAEHHDVDLIAFVQQPLLETFYTNVDAGLQECRAELSRYCKSVTFLPIERAIRPFGKLRTAMEGLFRRGGYTASWLDSPAARKQIAQCVRGHHYDIAHFDSLSLASYRPLLAGTPCTLGHHNAESHMLIRRADRESNVLKKVYFRQEAARLALFEKRIAEWFRLHITCSELDSQRLRTTMPRARMVCVPNGVDTDYFAPGGQPHTPNSLIFVGTMNWYPNVDAVSYLLRDVWPLLHAKIPAATLDIVGAGAPPALKELAVRCAGVTLHGFLPEIRPLIDRAALYVCPIRDGGGTKLKILDALAMAKCIVAHAVACEGVDVTPQTDVIFADTPDEFVTQIEWLLADPQRRRTIGAAARRLAVSKYSFATVGAKFTAALRSVADEKPPARS
jgi:glycosyltransferase involved in cell wall biosynthesis